MPVQPVVRTGAELPILPRMDSLRGSHLRDPERAPRVERTLDVVIHDLEAYPLIGRDSKTVNLSATGILMVVPARLDVVLGQEVVVTLRWPGGVYESQGRIVRLETEAHPGDTRGLMGLHMQARLPVTLITTDPAHAA